MLLDSRLLEGSYLMKNAEQADLGFSGFVRPKMWHVRFRIVLNCEIDTFWISVSRNLTAAPCLRKFKLCFSQFFRKYWKKSKKLICLKILY